MVDKLKPYVVKQGDYLSKLAFIYAFDAEAVWDHELNSALKSARKSGDMLAPGDVLYLPVTPKEGLPFTSGGTNRYKGSIPMVDVNLAFHDMDEKPIANAAFTIDVPGVRPNSGTSDGDGKVSFKVPVTHREVPVLFPDLNLIFHVRVGDLDPADEMTGAMQRLAHLGYFAESDMGNRDADLALAVLRFQRLKGLEETGALDAATLEALEGVHGT
ncbi:MAG: peptidoglycan-binding protein [Polyangiaceae bacterium]|nr:peptidoglycan-binding protein [Polyangiaceae bacterium]